MTPLGERLDKLAESATIGHQLSQPSPAQGHKSEDRRPSRGVALGLAVLVVATGMSVWLFRGSGAESTSVVAAHGTGQPQDSEAVAPGLIPLQASEDTDDGGATDGPPDDHRLGFLSHELRRDLDHLQAAIDYRLQLDIAQCLRRRGWEAPDPILQKRGPADRVDRSSVTALQAAVDFPRSDALAGFRSGLSSDDLALYESHWRDCLFRSDWNVGHPLDRVLGHTATEHASNAVAVDPVFLAAQAERSACTAAISDEHKQQAEALESDAQRLLREFQTGMASEAQVRGLLPSLLAREADTTDLTERCEQAYSAVVASLYDGYFAEFMRSDPDLERRIAELQREVDVYREILDELMQID